MCGEHGGAPLPHVLRTGAPVFEPAAPSEIVNFNGTSWKRIKEFLAKDTCDVLFVQEIHMQARGVDRASEWMR